MARAGLDCEKVVDAGERVAAVGGLAGLTWAAVATDLGVRPPSLYNHVDSLDDLHDRLCRRGVEALDAIVAEVVAEGGTWSALAQVARRWRALALARPGLRAGLGRPASAFSATTAAVADRLVGRLVDLFVARGFEGEAAVHAVRCFRAGVEGFILVEAGGGFGRSLSVEASFDLLVVVLIRGLSAQSLGAA